MSSIALDLVSSEIARMIVSLNKPLEHSARIHWLMKDLSMPCISPLVCQINEHGGAEGCAGVSSKQRRQRSRPLGLPKSCKALETLT